MPPFTLQARYVFPVASSPIPDGTITIDGGRIVALGSGCGEGEVLELGNAAILPGLVNAHAHLDFSDLTSPLGEPGIGFVDWIRLVMDRRCAFASNTDIPLNSRGLTARDSDRVALGLHESLRHGVTTLGEIAQAAAVDFEVGTAAVDLGSGGRSETTIRANKKDVKRVRHNSSLQVSGSKYFLESSSPSIKLISRKYTHPLFPQNREPGHHFLLERLP